MNTHASCLGHFQAYHTTRTVTTNAKKVSIRIVVDLPAAVNLTNCATNMTANSMPKTKLVHRLAESFRVKDNQAIMKGRK